MYFEGCCIVYEKGSPAIQKLVDDFALALLDVKEKLNN
jgi:hypothetical protein